MLSQTVKDSRVVWGGGWPEAMMAARVDDLAKRTAGKKALAVEAFSAALRGIPATLADNAGLDSADLVSQLRAAHTDPNSTAGLDMTAGQVGKSCPPAQLPCFCISLPHQCTMSKHWIRQEGRGQHTLTLTALLGST